MSYTNVAYGTYFPPDIHSTDDSYPFTVEKKNNNYFINMDMNNIPEGYSFNRTLVDEKLPISIDEYKYLIGEKTYGLFGYKNVQAKIKFKKRSLNKPSPGQFFIKSVEEQTGGTKRKTNKRTKRKNARKSRKQRI